MDVEEYMIWLRPADLSTTPEGRIVKVNRTFTDWVGYSQAELTSGLRVTDLLTVGSRIFYETHLALLLRMHGVANEIAVDFSCKNGRPLAALVNAKQKRDTSDEPLLNWLTVFNATERRRYETELVAARRTAEASAKELRTVNAQLSKSYEELVKANADLAQFAFVASHDLQEPLRSITVFSQMLGQQYKGTLGADADTYLTFITDGTVRTKALIDDLRPLRARKARPLYCGARLFRQPSIALSNLRSPAINKATR